MGKETRKTLSIISGSQQVQLALAKIGALIIELDFLRAELSTARKQLTVFEEENKKLKEKVKKK